MAKSTSTVPAIVKKALAESNKSEGMRLLLRSGMTVTQVKDAFNAPYGFVYGVALRAGLHETAANRRAPRKVVATKAKVAKKAAATQPSTASKVKAARSPKSTQKVAGRPTAARRAANRAPRTVTAPTKTSAASKRAAAANR